MDRRPPLILLARPHAVSRLLGLGLAFALLMLVDAYLLVLAARRIGVYLLIAATASTGLFGALGAFSAYKRELATLFTRVGRGVYPRREFVRMLSLIVGATLLIVPGIGTDVLGIAVMIRPSGWIVGRVLERALRSQLELLYEYLRLEN